MIWFTSDTHFGHANIIKYCHRPWADVEQMDAALCAAWSTRVEPDDEVYHLGDFAFANVERQEELLAQLPGRKVLVRGNHDRRLGRLRQMEGWDRVEDYLEVELDDHLVVMSHFPLEVWNKDLAGSLHLHGHCHGTLPSPDRRRLDVGVDPMGYKPVPWEQVKDLLLRAPVPKSPTEPYGKRP